MKIRNKFISGLIFILIVSVIIMNVAITKVLKVNMERGINNSLKQVMNSTHEYIRYKLLTNTSKNKEESLIEEGSYIVKYITLNYQCTIDITDMQGKLIVGNMEEEFKNVVKNSNTMAMEGKGIVDLNYKDSGINAALTYPIFINDNYIGIVNIIKNFDSEYITYRNTMGFINIVEGGIFAVIFMFLFLMTTRITKPITALTNAVKMLGDGDYDVPINQHGKDEVAILAQEFISMKNKIREQIETIESEKDKVFKLEKGRREFFNSVTHELKTPLTAISGYAELLLTGMVEDKKFDKRAIERIYSESDRLHKLVLELIEVSKGIYVVKEEVKEVDMKKLITQSCNDMSIKASKYSLTIVQSISEGTIKAQEDRIRQVMINLIDNAIKYSVNGKEIYVNSHLGKNKYYIEVINKSTLIPEEIFNNIFEPFVKINEANNKESRGLGLYLCNEIIKEHGGDIIIENGELVKVRVTLTGSI